LRLGVVVSELNADFVDRMLMAAKRVAASLGVEITYVCSVPGCYDAPLIVKELLSKDDVDSVVVLGSLVKETSLEEYIFNQLVGRLMDLSLEYGKPVCLGISAQAYTGMTQCVRQVLKHMRGWLWMLPSKCVTD